LKIYFVNFRNKKKKTQQVPKYFIFNVGVEGNSKELLTINATTKEVKVKN